MLNFVLNSHHLCEVFLHYFISKKTTAESHRILVKASGEHASSETTWLVSTFSKWWFRPQQQRPWKTTEKNWRCRIAGIAGRRFDSNPTKIGESIGRWPGNYFQMLCHWKDPKRRKIGVVRIKRKRHWKAKNHLWNFVWSFQKKFIFVSNCYWRWKWIYFDNPKRKKSWVDPGQPSTSQPVRNIHGKKAVYLVGSEGSCVL